MKPPPNSESAESLSALMDGQLPAAEARRWWSAHADDPDMARRWQHYHLLGEVLRQPAQGAQAGVRLSDEGLTQRILHSVKGLPMDARTPLQAPATQHPPAGLPVMQPHAATPGAPGAANDTTFRWRAWSGAVAVVAVVSVALNLWQMSDVPQLARLEPDRVAPLASVPGAQPPGVSTVAGGAAEPVPSQTQTLIRDPRLDELLLAHRQAGATSALQSPSGFLRHATFEGGR